MTSLLKTTAVEKSDGKENPSRPFIRFSSIFRSFKDIIALADVSFDVALGTMHAIVGENGAGKTTLMRILSGSLRPDAGAISLNGTSLSFGSPAHALRAGIGMVYQNFSLISSLTVLDNILLGDCRNSFRLRHGYQVEKVEDAAKRFGFKFDLLAPVWRLGMAERQKLEIFKLLWRDAQILILDEPTSQLPPFEGEDILDILTELARKGRTVVLVSHHLQEVLRFCTRITVLRRGRFVDTVDPRTTSVSDLAGLVVGTLPVCSEPDHKSIRSGLPLLGLRDVSVRPTTGVRALRQIALDIYSGEMIGVAGVLGSGQDELVGVLTGQLSVSRGELLLDGKVSPWKVLKQADSPVAYIPADSRGTSTISRLSLTDNLFLREAVRAHGLLGPILFPGTMRHQASSWLKLLDIRPADPDLSCSALSGGNLQRLVITRELLTPSRILVAVNPTAGLNVAAALEVRRILRDLVNGKTIAGESTNVGQGVLLVSSDLRELLLCDRVVVLHRGEIVGIEDTRNLDAESLGLLMGGMKADLVRALKNNGSNAAANGQEELRSALHQLLESQEWWQRKLAVQTGFRLLAQADAARLEVRLATEDHPAVRAWLRLALARLDPERHLLGLESSFAANGRGPAISPEVTELLGAQMYLLGCEDLPSLQKALVDRLSSELPSWERVLGRNVLRVFGAEETESNLEPCAAVNATDGPR